MTSVQPSEVIDATGLLVMPGGIDSHVHLDQAGAPGIVMADGFESGTRSAAIGGNTMVLPFCLQQKGQSLREALAAYQAKADGKCYTDIAHHLIITDPTPQVLGQETAGADRRGLHLGEDLHDLRRHEARRPGDP